MYKPNIQHEFIAIDEGHATLLHINSPRGVNYGKPPELAPWSKPWHNPTLANPTYSTGRAHPPTPWGERDASKNWIVPIGRPQSRDMQLVGSNRILTGHHHGYTEFDITTGKVAKEFTALEGVTAARRQANGQPCGKTHARPARNPGGQPALRFYGVARSLKNKILFVDNFRVKQLNRLVLPGNLWL